MIIKHYIKNAKVEVEEMVQQLRIPKGLILRPNTTAN